MRNLTTRGAALLLSILIAVVGSYGYTDCWNAMDATRGLERVGAAMAMVLFAGITLLGSAMAMAIALAQGMDALDAILDRQQQATNRDTLDRLSDLS